MKSKKQLIALGIPEKKRADTYFILGSVWDSSKIYESDIEIYRKQVDNNRSLIKGKDYPIVKTSTIVELLNSVGREVLSEDSPKWAGF